MAVIYRHSYADLSIYGHVVALLENAKLGQGVHVDIGCGYGAIAEPIADRLKLDYIGFDMAEDGLADLRARGFGAEKINLLDLDEAERIIRKAVGTRPIVSMTIVDTLEHLVNGQDVLAMLRRIAGDSGSLLVVSIPNVNHKDIALKGLAGRWDITEAGLLDHTHVDFYNRERLALRASVSGWQQVDAKDWLLEISDQHFPPDLPLLDVGSPLGGMLRELVEDANPDLLVNQFVRAFRPTEPADLPVFGAPSVAQETGLSVVVVVRDDGLDGDEASRTLNALARQSEGAFEVIVVLVTRRKNAARAKKHCREALGGIARLDIVTLSTAADDEAFAAGVARASGSHVAFLPLGTVLAEGWASDLRSAIAANPLRVAWLSRGELRHEHLSPFLVPDQPVAAFAVPRLALTELGLGANAAPAQAGLQTIITRAILYCGLEQAQPAGETLLDWPRSPAVDPVPDAVLSYLNSRPFVVPAGTAVAIQRTLNALGESLAVRAALEDEKLNAGPPEPRLSELLALVPQLRELASPYVEALKLNLPAVEDEVERPFLSIVTRTQGTRIGTLSEMLLSLAGQSSTNFEMVIVVHSPDMAVMAQITELVSEFPRSLGERIRLHQCTRPGRAAPLNDGVAVARGQYIAVLDDDDFVFGHYVETFEQLHDAGPGKLLRAVCARQKFEHVDRGDFSRSRALSWFDLEWQSKYDPISHLGGNYTPFMSIAFPRAVFGPLGMRFDESLTTLEDWELTSRAAALCGVESSPEVTSVYRWWINAKSSLFVHAADEWTSNRQRVIDEASSRPLLLPSGSRAAIVALAERREALEREVADLYRQIEDMRGELRAQVDREHVLDSEIRSSLQEHLRSSSWHVTRRLRKSVAAIRGLRDGEAAESVPASIQDAWHRLQQIQSSTSWELAAPIRLIGRLLRVEPRPASDAMALEGDAAIAAARLHVDSTSWRMTRPLRVASARLRGQTDTGPTSADVPADPEAARRMIHDIRNSTSWKLTFPVRLVGRVVGRYGRKPDSAG